MSGRGNAQQVRELIKEIEELGCVVTYRAGAGHYKIVTPSGQPIFMSSTPSDYRAVYKTRAILRRHGVHA